MTAIAAVIALSSTPLLAQTTDSAATPPAPLVVAPPPPAVTAPPAAEMSAAPEVAAPAPVVAPAPAPAIKTVGTPVVHDADVAAAETAPTRTAPASVKRVTTARPHAATPVAAASVATPAQAEAAPAPVAAPAARNVPTAAETAASTPAASPAPVAATQTTRTTSTDDTLPIAGGVGAAVILLGGAAAFAIRRRRPEGEEIVTDTAPVETVVVPEAEPVVIAPQTVARAPIAATGMPKTLPNGFDLSRFGRHTQAAYLGRTPDNPSHSLKRRLKRASFFDQREREAAAAGHPVEQTPIEAPSQQAARAAQDDGQITVRLAPQRKSSGFGYIFQR